jgi:hypothetical protein
MTPELTAALIAVGVIVLLLLGALRLMRPREMTLPDYPELPPPPKDEASKS